jgi:hypothetical protein
MNRRFLCKYTPALVDYLSVIRYNEGFPCKKRATLVKW